MARGEKYEAFRNLFFNELGITKEDIREWVKEACQEVADKLVSNTYESFNPETFIRKAMAESGFICNGRLASDIRRAVVESILDKLDIRLKEAI